MATTTYTQPTSTDRSSTDRSKRDGASRWVLPVAGVALGVAGVVLSVVAITTDDVAETTFTPPAVESQPVVDDAIVTRQAVLGDPDSCEFARTGAIDRC